MSKFSNIQLLSGLFTKFDCLGKALISKKVYLFIPFLVGVGFVHVLVTGFLIVAVSLLFLLRFRYFVISIKEILMSILWITFFLLYFFNYIPPEIENQFIPLSKVWYIINVVPVFLVGLLLVMVRDIRRRFEIIIAIAFGMFVFALANTISTLIILDPPYYGRAYHSLHHYIYNSPGTTILGSILPVVLISFYGYSKKWRLYYNFFLVLSVVLSFLISLIYLARTPILIILLGVVIKFGTFAYERTNKFIIKKQIQKFIFFVLFICILFLFFSDYSVKLIERFVYGHYSIKVQHQIDYWNQVAKDFWIYPRAGITMPEVYFHNFFYDAHRTSGPFTALVAYLIFGFTVFNSMELISANSRIGIYFFTLHLLFSAFLFTTIPWESSESQMVALYVSITLLSCNRIFVKKEELA